MSINLKSLVITASTAAIIVGAAIYMQEPAQASPEFCYLGSPQAVQCLELMMGEDTDGDGVIGPEGGIENLSPAAYR
jgi:hypothetical protein